MEGNISLFELFQDSFKELENSNRISDLTIKKIELQRRERDRLLAPYAQKTLQTRGRIIPEDDCNVRSCYERDLGRIMYSQAFRRLKHKTQVFFNPANDHICSRLEHVLYVDYIAATIGQALGLNVDLIRAMALPLLPPTSFL